MRRRGLTIAAAIAGLLTSTLSNSGCAFAKLRKDLQLAEGYVEVLARVEAQGWAGLPLLIVAGHLPDSEDNLPIIEVRSIRVLREPQPFAMNLEPGRYVLGAFEDANRNSRHDPGERGVLSPQFEVRLDQLTPEVTLEITSAFDRSAIEGYEILSQKRPAIGEVVALDDPRFAPELAKIGLWQPLTYVLEQDPGVYMLEPFDPARTPVLFIHGMGGHPREFAPLIASLDTARFQPWVFLYPSGYPLTDLAHFLHNALVEIEHQHAFPRMCVVAHSMGGLVARGMLHDHADPRQPQSVRGLVTLASPLGGIPSAEMGTKLAPQVIPAWIDLVPDSPYLRMIYEDPLPAEVEYHLLFAYNQSGSSDGTVTLLSQLRDQAQDEAEVVRGYPTTHTGVLTAPPVIAQVNRALARCSGDLDLPRIAPRQ